jgi:hypothetical protein
MPLGQVVPAAAQGRVQRRGPPPFHMNRQTRGDAHSASALHRSSSPLVGPPPPLPLEELDEELELLLLEELDEELAALDELAVALPVLALDEEAPPIPPMPPMPPEPAPPEPALPVPSSGTHWAVSLQ